MNLKPQMAFISRCIYEQNKPILCAIRTVPCSEWDSGWLFLANNDGEPEAPLMLINVEDVPEIDSSIAGLLNAPYNFTYSKNSPKDRWRVLGNDYESRGFAYRNNKLNAQVAFVCRHIVDDPLPALAAIRSEPAFAGDSG